MDEALTAVREKFWRHGYAGTSVDRILEATKPRKGQLLRRLRRQADVVPPRSPRVRHDTSCHDERSTPRFAQSDRGAASDATSRAGAAWLLSRKLYRRAFAAGCRRRCARPHDVCRVRGHLHRDHSAGGSRRRPAQNYASSGARGRLGRGYQRSRISWTYRLGRCSGRQGQLQLCAPPSRQRRPSEQSAARLEGPMRTAGVAVSLARCNVGGPQSMP